MKALATLTDIQREDLRKPALFSLLGAYYADDVCKRRQSDVPEYKEDVTLS